MNVRALPRRIPQRFSDGLMALGWLVAIEGETFTTERHHGPLILHALVGAGMAAATLWRRRAPLAFAAVALGCALGLSSLWSLNNVIVAPTYVLIFIPYSLAREAPLARALWGSGAALAMAIAANASSKSTVGGYLAVVGLAVAAWSVGRWFRARHQLNRELAQRAERIEAERASRISLAVADERTRIARELHTVVAANMSAMVILAEAADLLLDGDPAAADEAMAAMEQTGRTALSDMRRLLGVLRRPSDSSMLVPQPGVGELYALVESARGSGRTVELEVEGKPGPLPVGVDLGIYRMVEDVLANTGSGGAMIQVRFDDDQIVLEASVADSTGLPTWPTLAMSERAAICHGSIQSELSDGRRRLHVSFPRAFEEAFA